MTPKRAAITALTAVLITAGATAGGVHATTTNTPNTPKPRCVAKPVNIGARSEDRIKVVCIKPRPPRATVTQTVTARTTVTAKATVNATVTATVTVTATPSSSPVPSPTSSSTPTPTPTPSSSPTTPTPTPTTPPSTGFPDASNTGPTGTLTAYTGPCTITTAGTVIDSKVINCVPLQISTIGVVVKNSKINGAVRVGVQDDYNPATVSDPEGDDPIRVTILDSEIDATAAAGSGFRPISFSHYIVRNSYLHGGGSGAECHNACTIEDSYVHGFGEHSSGMRILRNGTLRGNTIWCEPNPNSDDDGDGVPDVDGGCSGNLTMYEEFGVPHHNLVERNYFPAGWFWFSLKFNGNDNGNIRIVGNTFGIKKPGAGLADGWDVKATNLWSGNTFTNGGVASP